MNSTQRIIKYFAIAFAACLIVAIFTGIYRFGGMFIGNFINHHGNGLNIEKYKDDENILSVDIAFSNLIIKTGDEFKVDVKNNKYIQTKQKNNKLTITEKSHNLARKNKSEIVIYIPENIVFDKVYIGGGAGSIIIDKLDSKNLELEIGAGDVNITKINVLNKTKIEGGVGEVTIKKSNLNNLELETGIGEINLGAVLTGKSEIEAGIGELNIDLLDSRENYTIKAETGIGSMMIDNKRVKNDIKYGVGSNKIKLEGGIGSINVTFAN